MAKGDSAIETRPEQTQGSSNNTKFV